MASVGCGESIWLIGTKVVTFGHIQGLALVGYLVCCGWKRRDLSIFLSGIKIVRPADKKI